MVYMQIPFVITPEIAKRSECRDAYRDNKLGYQVNRAILLHLRSGIVWFSMFVVERSKISVSGSKVISVVF